MANVKQLCRDVKRVLKDVLEIAENERPVDNLEKWSENIIPEHVHRLEQMLGAAADVHEKQVLRASIASCLSIRNQLQQLLLQHVGSGLTDSVVDGVKWGDLQSAFKSCIKSSIVNNIKHLDVDAFLDNVKSIVSDKIEQFIREHNAVKVNVTLSGEYFKTTINRE